MQIYKIHSLSTLSGTFVRCNAILHSFLVMTSTRLYQKSDKSTMLCMFTVDVIVGGGVVAVSNVLDTPV